MKKYLVFLAGICLCLSCSKVLPENTQTIEEQPTLTITGALPSLETKTQTGSDGVTVWNTGDVITITLAGTDYTYTVVEGGSATAAFAPVGAALPLLASYELTATYSPNGLAGTQTNEGGYNHNAPLSATYEGEAAGGAIALSFSQDASLIEFNFKDAQTGQALAVGSLVITSVNAENLWAEGASVTVTPAVAASCVQAVVSKTTLAKGILLAATAGETTYYKVIKQGGADLSASQGVYARISVNLNQQGISNLNDLKSWRYLFNAGLPTVNYLNADGEVALLGDITLDSWATIPAFEGTLNGNGHKIAGLKTPFIESLSGTVKNVKFENIAISQPIAHLCSVAIISTGIIENVAVTGNITPADDSKDSFLGGIVSELQGNAVVRNCYSSVNINLGGKPGFLVGGIAGAITSTSNDTSVEISSCTYEGTITCTGAGGKTGGILGRKTNGAEKSTDIIADCLFCGTINMNTSTGACGIGGIFGALQGGTKVGSGENCYAGGLIIKRCATNGIVKGGFGTGGIAGWGPTVVDCFATGDIHASAGARSASDKNGMAAGITAASKGNIIRCVVTNASVRGVGVEKHACAGICSKSNSGTTTVNYCYVANLTFTDATAYPMLGDYNEFSSSINNVYSNYRLHGSFTGGNSCIKGDGTPNVDQRGGNYLTEAPDQAWFEAKGYDFENVWTWNAEGSYPELKNPGCSAEVKNM